MELVIPKSSPNPDPSRVNFNTVSAEAEPAVQGRQLSSARQTGASPK
jgi:hypothetical protein